MKIRGYGIMIKEINVRSILMTTTTVGLFNQFATPGFQAPKLNQICMSCPERFKAGNGWWSGDEFWCGIINITQSYRAGHTEPLYKCIRQALRLTPSFRHDGNFENK